MGKNESEERNGPHRCSFSHCTSPVGSASAPATMTRHDRKSVLAMIATMTDVSAIVNLATPTTSIALPTGDPVGRRGFPCLPEVPEVRQRVRIDVFRGPERSK